MSNPTSCHGKPTIRCRRCGTACCHTQTNRLCDKCAVTTAWQSTDWDLIGEYVARAGSVAFMLLGAAIIIVYLLDHLRWVP